MNKKQIKVLGAFKEDSAKIGQNFHYSLWVKHPGTTEIFFPNTQNNFAPFEITQKDYFKTKKLADGMYLDSAVYHMHVFSPNSINALALPIYTISDVDCTAIYPKPDTLFIKKLVPHPEQIKLDSLYQTIPFEPLTPKKDIKTFLFDFLVILIIIGIVNWLFGKKLRMAYELYRLWRKNRDFTRAFQRLFRNINQTSSGIKNLEKALVLWKKYLENISGLGFSTSTSKEILDLLPDKRLEIALNDMDFAIYGGNFSENTLHNLEILLQIAESSYKRAQQKIRITFRNK